MAYGGIVNRSIAYLYCNNYNKVNISHSDVQKYICYIILLRVLPFHVQDRAILFLEMIGRMF